MIGFSRTMAHAIALAGVFHGASAAAATLLAPNTYFIEGEAVPNRQPDGNTTVILAPQGVIVFDTGRHQGHAQGILDFVQAQDRPIAAIINSHWHLDHVGGNPRLRAAFPNLRVYASSAIDDALKGFLADYRAQLVAEIAGAENNPEAQAAMRTEVALIDSGAALGPTEIVAKSSRLTIAGRVLQLHLEPHAVTAGDVWVFDPATRVLLAGDLVTLPAPFFESACPPRWRASLAHLEKAPFEWLVPGHGAPMHRREFAVYRKAFSNLLDCAAGEAPKDACIDGWGNDAGALFHSSADVSYARTLIAYYLENYLRNPGGRIRKLCDQNG
jgi:glyoxylase-like metal-dependent hydrolase (beta-lactamase superfamily II)